MIPEKTIQICGKDVKMRYCAAAETGYELMTDKSSTVFSPVVTEYGEDGKPLKVSQPEANTFDYINLAIAAIVAAYERENQEPPITSKEILMDATPAEVTELIKTVLELRMKWYNIPAVVPATETDEPPTPDDPKNVRQPAKRSRRS